MPPGEPDQNPDLTQPSLIELAQAAFLAASVKVVQQAEQHGVPVIVWEDHQIRYLSAAEAWERLRASSSTEVHSCRDVEQDGQSPN